MPPQVSVAAQHRLSTLGLSLVVREIRREEIWLWRTVWQVGKFFVESVHCRGGEQKRIGEGLKKFTSAHLHLFASNSRYETEDQSEYRTDEEEANGLPQTDLDERETEIGCKLIWTFQSEGNVFKSGESEESETEVGESDIYDEEEVVDFKARRRGAFSDEQVIEIPNQTCTYTVLLYLSLYLSFVLYWHMGRLAPWQLAHLR